MIPRARVPGEKFLGAPIPEGHGRSLRLICLCKFDTILSSQRSPSFVGDVVSEKRHTILKGAKRWAFRDETVADRFSSGWYCGVRVGLRAAVAPCARRRRRSGGTG